MQVAVASHYDQKCPLPFTLLVRLMFLKPGLSMQQKDADIFKKQNKTKLVLPDQRKQ